jgi:hypothetical protein
VQCRRVKCQATKEELSTPALVAAVAGLVANPVCLWSEYTLKTTGSGLPPGPGGTLGAAEGVSYLVCSLPMYSLPAGSNTSPCLLHPVLHAFSASYGCPRSLLLAAPKYCNPDFKGSDSLVWAPRNACIVRASAWGCFVLTTTHSGSTILWSNDLHAFGVHRILVSLYQPVGPQKRHSLDL